jgi:hypothetical protein
METPLASIILRVPGLSSLVGQTKYFMASFLEIEQAILLVLSRILFPEIGSYTRKKEASIHEIEASIAGILVNVAKAF